MRSRARTTWCFTGLIAALTALGGCDASPEGPPAAGGSREAALALTPAQETAVAALAYTRPGRRGDPLALLDDVQDLVGVPVACDEVAEHLGMPLPTFPTLHERGFTLTCGSSDGTGVFEHPVPSAANPPSPAADPAADVHGVTIAYLPPGVDPHETSFSDARREGLVWMSLLYGGYIAQPTAAPTATEPPHEDFTLLTFRNGNVLGVQYMNPGDTRLAWRSVTADHVFHVSVNTSGDPVAGVALLEDGVDLPT